MRAGGTSRARLTFLSESLLGRSYERNKELTGDVFLDEERASVRTVQY